MSTHLSFSILRKKYSCCNLKKIICLFSILNFHKINFYFIIQLTLCSLIYFLLTGKKGGGTQIKNTQLHKNKIKYNKTYTKHGVCLGWPITPEKRACLGVWLIHIVLFHCWKLIFCLLAAPNWKQFCLKVGCLAHSPFLVHRFYLVCSCVSFEFLSQSLWVYIESSPNMSGK